MRIYQIAFLRKKLMLRGIRYGIGSDTVVQYESAFYQRSERTGSEDKKKSVLYCLIIFYTLQFIGNSVINLFA